MSREIIKKDNGDYAVWSTIIDDFIFEGSLDEYKKILIEEETAKINYYIDNVKNNSRLSGRSYQEACQRRDLIHNNIKD